MGAFAKSSTAAQITRWGSEKRERTIGNWETMGAAQKEAGDEVETDAQQYCPVRRATALPGGGRGCDWAQWSVTNGRVMLRCLFAFTPREQARTPVPSNAEPWEHES